MQQEDFHPGAQPRASYIDELQMAEFAGIVTMHIPQKFFTAVLDQARAADLLSDEHFTVDGTLVEALGESQKLQTQGR